MNNTTINELYKKARQLALSVYSDCKLSHFSIQVYPFDCLEDEDSIIKSRVTLYFTFFAKHAKKVCKIRCNETYGIDRETPDDDADWLYSHPYPNLPWVGVQWKTFLAKAFERVKPLTDNKKTYYNVFVYSTDKNLPWIACFYDGYNGRRQVGRWNGKGSSEKDITILWDN